MIYIKDFTSRLGNQLFQIAAAIGAGYDSGNTAVYIPRTFNYLDKLSEKFETVSNFNRTLNNGISSGLWIQPGFNYHKIPYKEGMAISGYFQSYKYFENCSRLIKRYFTPRCRSEHVRNLGKRLCSIHLRLTDYLTLPDHHPVMTWESYFRPAIEKHKRVRGDDFTYVVFSDDIYMAKRYFPDGSVEFYQGESDIDDLSAMSLCDDNIICNSSFSWWGAYLNPDDRKVVICPSEERWFGPAYNHLDRGDLLLPEWIRV